MDYIEIIASVRAEEAERAGDVLRDATGRGVWVAHAFEQRDLESDAELRADGPVLVHAYADSGPGDAAVARARAALAGAGIAAEVTERVVAEEDWAESWKQFFHIERYGERIVVAPSWREHAARDGEIVLTIDPGMAFGTGQHETTRMCLEALERVMMPGMRVLDAGCGSGILSLAASKLGAESVAAVDIDPMCVRVTRENAKLNAIDGIDAREGSLGAAWPFEESASGRFDVVVANIIARVIIELAQELVGALAAGGRLIVSGVIREREREVEAALGVAGAKVLGTRRMGEWVCIEAVRA